MVAVVVVVEDWGVEAGFSLLGSLGALGGSAVVMVV
jgi:hypothetical protein